MESGRANDASARLAPSKSARASIEAGNAVQWLACVARSYAAAPSEDVSLFFDPASRRVMTPEIAPGMRLGLHLPSLVFQFEEDGTPTPHAFDVDAKSSSEIEAWLLAELLHRGLDRDRFDKQLPYEWPHPMSGDEIKYTAHDLADALDGLTRRLATAAASSTHARHELEDKGATAPSDRPWVPFCPKLFSIGPPRSDSATPR